ncbi:MULTISPECIES: hypothetical protein [Streptomyces]|uniref:Uncharacterized protein n=1 Tax=Streptomyces clavifer TaxID=68188 RepID=A0ABS4V8C0_9ACTN|nr:MULTISPECIES: hypothetical protein [Streptomyces]MBP2360151.1 hypothetical protein [Streptomyces clavifer]MDX2743311.1 hypothetical protein [Streptomyces sp. NRRL_B-2557]GHA97032.1 hypothetical protein GCM10010392_24380 [Streptomyces clavifer]
MPKYSFIAEAADTMAPGEITSARGTLTAPSPEAARKTVESSLRSRGYEPTEDITVTPK